MLKKLFFIVWLCSVIVTIGSLDKSKETVTPMILTDFVNQPGKLKIFIHAESTLDIEVTKNGTAQGKEAFQNGCRYDGKVNDVEYSRATLNLCGGMTGFIKIQGNLYLIYPKSAAKNRNISLANMEVEHVFYTLRRSKFEVAPSRLVNRRYRKDLKPDIKRAVKFLELYLVNDRSVYNFFEKNVTFIEERCENITRLLDEKLRHLRIRVVLVGVEIWTDNDLSDVTTDSHHTLVQFMNYRRNHINNNVRNDNAQLITKRIFDKGRTLGKAPIGTICSSAYSAGIDHDSHGNPKYVANVIAHELGHNLGMHHDQRDPLCDCHDHSNYKCIMNNKLDKQVKSFSTCSKHHFENFMENGHGSCLFDFPSHRSKPSICGNGIIEAGEECDCGHPDNCAKFGFCCHQITCKLFKNATCASGECCDKCRLKGRSTPCRYQRGECDLPEMCSGEQANCPMDVHAQDTTSCSSGKGYCIGGVCSTHHHQCYDLFGNNSTSADGYCYTELNTKGKEFGHCGKTPFGFKSCDLLDAYCGKLQCETRQHEKAYVNKIKWSYTGETMECISKPNDVEYNHANDGDLSLARDGTRCGHNSICMKQNCISLPEYHAVNNVTTCSRKCSGNGVCNNKNNCHCKPGWAPPFCDMKGLGGSIDSGPFASPHQNSDIAPNKIKLYVIIGVCAATVLIACAAGLVFKLPLLMKIYREKRSREKQRKYKEELKTLL